MSKHTPGPWKLDDQAGVIYAPNGRSLLDVDYIGCESETEWSANARLIAAAPEQHEALLEAAAQFEAIRNGIGLSVSQARTYDKIRAAIAKATGE